MSFNLGLRRSTLRTGASSGACGCRLLGCNYIIGSVPAATAGPVLALSWVWLDILWLFTTMLCWSTTGAAAVASFRSTLVRSPHCEPYRVDKSADFSAGSSFF